MKILSSISFLLIEIKVLVYFTDFIDFEIQMTHYGFPVLFDHVSRDSVEDPLDDTGTVQQQLDQVKCLFWIQFFHY